MKHRALLTIQEKLKLFFLLFGRNRLRRDPHKHVTTKRWMMVLVGVFQKVESAGNSSHFSVSPSSLSFFFSSYQFFCEQNAGTLSTMDYTQVRLVSQPFQFVSKEIKKKKRHGNHAVTSRISFVSESAFITVKWSVLSTNLDKNSFVIFLGWDAATIFTDTKRPLT